MVVRREWRQMGKKREGQGGARGVQEVKTTHEGEEELPRIDARHSQDMTHSPLYPGRTCSCGQVRQSS